MVDWPEHRVLVAFLSGDLAFLRHCVVRVQLWRVGLLPGRLRRFLDDAVGCSFPHPSGPAGYAFSHRILQDYFASLRPAPSARPQAPEEQAGPLPGRASLL